MQRLVNCRLVAVAMVIPLTGCTTMPNPHWINPMRVTEFAAPPGRPSLVMLHGVYHGSWAFEEFRTPFIDAGFPVILVDLRGHWGEHRLTPRSPVGYGEYLEDANQALDRIAGNKVVIGHSLGGLLALSTASRPDVVANVLIAPPLPEAVRRKQWHLLAEFPMQTARFVMTGNAAALYHDMHFADRYLFSRHTPMASKSQAMARIREQDEPYRVFKEVMSLELPSPSRPLPTLIVLGAEDPTVTAEVGKPLQLMTTGDVLVVPDAGHDVMLEPNATETCARILDWLERRFGK